MRENAGPWTRVISILADAGSEHVNGLWSRLGHKSVRGPDSLASNMAEVTKQPVVGGDANRPDAPTAPMPTARATPLVDVGTDHCPNCGADLAVDQRYCVECGQRRGKPRYTLAGPEPVVPVAPPPTRSGGRFSPSLALLAGLGMLLLALGVGVLIGHSGNNTSGHQPVNVTVGGGLASNSGSGTANTATTGGTSSGTHHSSNSGKSAAKANKALPTAAKKVTAPKTLKKAAATASKHVTSTTGQSSIGSKCSGGAGCHHGKQTGVFFGG